MVSPPKTKSPTHYTTSVERKHMLMNPLKREVQRFVNFININPPTFVKLTYI